MYVVVCAPKFTSKEDEKPHSYNNVFFKLTVLLFMKL